MADEDKWVGDVIDTIRTGVDLLQVGAELAEQLQGGTDQFARLSQVVAMLCKRTMRDEQTIDALRERVRNLEQVNGQQGARISVLEKARERP